eukprot:6999466-Pyramimonas_sp.AAC.1
MSYTARTCVPQLWGRIAETRRRTSTRDRQRIARAPSIRRRPHSGAHARLAARGARPPCRSSGERPNSLVKTGGP